MAINSTLANQIFFASQGVPATGKENTAGQAYSDAVSYAHAAIYNPFEVLGGNTQAFVVKIYETILGRTNPLVDDPTGVVYWKNLIDNGTLSKAAFIDEMTVAAIRNGGADELAAKNANKAYIEEIYASVLGRAAGDDQAGKDYWTNALNTGAISRSQIVDEISKAAVANGDEGFKTANAAFIDNLYLSLLNRAADQEGKDYWLNQLNSGTSKANLVVDLINGTAPSADKANLDAKTKALNAFSTNFTDYNVLPGSETYDNARNLAGAEIKGITAATADPVAEVTTFLNNGYKAQYQEDTPAPVGTTVYATWNGALRAEWADATNTANAEVTFKADTEEEKGLIREAEKLGVDVSSNTNNVLFKNLNGASDKLVEVHINSNPNSAATVNVDALAQLPAAELLLRDRDGATKINWTNKVANLTKIELENGDDNVYISNANNIGTKVEIDGGAGNDIVTLGAGNFAGKVGLKDVEKIVSTTGEAPVLYLSDVSDGTTPSYKADKLNITGDLKLIVDNGTIGSGTATQADISQLTGDLNSTVILDASSGADTLATVKGNAQVSDALDLGTEKTFSALATIDGIDVVVANKATLNKASALEKGFFLAGDVTGLSAGSLILTETTATTAKIDASKLTGTVDSTLNIDATAASGNLTDVIGSANLNDTLDLKAVAYSKLANIKDIDLVKSTGAKLKVIDPINTGFNLQGDITAELSGAGITSVDLSKMTAVLKDDGSKSTINVDAATNSANVSGDLTKVIGSTDANISDKLTLLGVDATPANYTKLAQIKDIDLVEVSGGTAGLGSGAKISVGATADGFELKGSLVVAATGTEAAIDLSKITASANGQFIDIDANAAKGNVVTILGTDSVNISDRLNVTTKTDFTRLASIDQVDIVNLSGDNVALATITNAVEVSLSGANNALTSIQATGAVDLKALDNGHTALTSVVGKTVDLGSGDFTALTELTGAVKTTGATAAATAAKLSYDNLAEQITTTGLVLDGSAATWVSISDATTTGVSTDLSKVTVAGTTASGNVTITNVDADITLSGKTQAIKEAVQFDQTVTISATPAAGTKSGLVITNVAAGDSLDLTNIAAKINDVSGTGTTATEVSGTSTLSEGDFSFYKLVGLEETAALDNSVTVAGILSNVTGGAIKATASENAILALNNATTNKSYIYAVNNDANTAITAEELKLVAVVDTLVTDAAKFGGVDGTGNGSIITFA